MGVEGSTDPQRPAARRICGSQLVPAMPWTAAAARAENGGEAAVRIGLCGPLNRRALVMSAPDPDRIDGDLEPGGMDRHRPGLILLVLVAWPAGSGQALPRC